MDRKALVEHNRKQPASQPLYTERHFSVAELSQLWNLSPQTIRKLFQKEAGVIRVGATPLPGKRPYRTMLIPESVANRVHTSLRAAS